MANKLMMIMCDKRLIERKILTHKQNKCVHFSLHKAQAFFIREIGLHSPSLKIFSKHLMTIK